MISNSVNHSIDQVMIHQRCAIIRRERHGRGTVRPGTLPSRSELTLARDDDVCISSWSLRSLRNQHLVALAGTITRICERQHAEVAAYTTRMRIPRFSRHLHATLCISPTTYPSLLPKPLSRIYSSVPIARCHTCSLQQSVNPSSIRGNIISANPGYRTAPNILCCHVSYIPKPCYPRLRGLLSLSNETWQGVPTPDSRSSPHHPTRFNSWQYPPLVLWPRHPMRAGGGRFGLGHWPWPIWRLRLVGGRWVRR